MAVNVTAVTALNNPALFTEPLAFEIEYEALTNLQEDLAWKLIYVGSADNDRYDQVLEDVAVGPVHQGTYKFVLEANPPNPELIPVDDLVGVTVIMLTCSYRDQEFIRVGYYVKNEYLDEELRENPPEQPRLDQLQRVIVVEHPRVTRYVIPFDEPEPADGAQPMEIKDEPMAMDEGHPPPEMLQETGNMQMGQMSMQTAYMDAQPGALGQQQPQQHPPYVPVQ